MKFVVLGLGSNRSFNGLSCIQLLYSAVEELKKLLSDMQYSGVYRSKAMYVTDQEDFYNMVVAGCVSDNLDPHAFLKQTSQIETLLGRCREREYRFGPRSIDIDIEFFGDMKVSTPELEIPHPRIAERAFVLEPLLELLKLVADDKIGNQIKNTVNAYSGNSEGVSKYLSASDFSMIAEDKEFLKKMYEVQNGRITGSG